MLQLAVDELKYTLKRSNQLFSSISIRIHAERGVVVNAGRLVPLAIIDQFVQSKADWIQTNLQKVNSKKASPKSYSPDEKHLLWGRQYPLSFSVSSSPIRTQIELVGDSLSVITHQNHTPVEIKSSLQRFYKENIIHYLTEKTNYYCTILNVDYKKITIKEVSSIWGSCTRDNKLNFNTKLVLAPKEVVDYVVLHEVSHIIEKNHSSHFWALVARHDKYFREHRRWLKKNQHLLNF